MIVLDMTTADLLLAAAALAGFVIEGRRIRGDAEHRERTARLELQVERLTERLDEIDEALVDDEPEPLPKVKAPRSPKVRS